MSGQNINQYGKPNWGIKLNLDSQDMSLSNDEKDYNEEVVFSPYLIAQTYGNRLPFSLDINNTLSVQNQSLTYKNYNNTNVLISLNYYNKDNDDLSCYSGITSCDIGLTGVDNGLVTDMTGQTITFTNGLFDNNFKFNRLYFDRRLKLFQVTGNTESPNVRFSGFNKTTLYEVVSKTSPYEGRYHELYGGFYQGFYKLFGYDYNIFPERMNKGWSVEMLLKPRLINEYFPSSGETTLNEIYPDNKNTFFYLGARAENKFYHHADGSPTSLTGYTRITTPLTNLETCACCNTGVTNSRCIYVYPPRSLNGIHDSHVNYGCDVCGCSTCNTINEETCTTGCTTCGCVPKTYDTCGWECKQHACGTGYTSSVENTCESDPLFDSMSNAISFKLSGDPKNPAICVRILRITGDCVTTGTCSTTGITYTTGYTLDNYCTGPIYPRCQQENPAWLDEEHWFQLNAVWERYTWFDFCDLYYKGGLGDITEKSYLNSLSNNSISLVTAEYTHSGATPAEQIELVKLNEKWLIEKSYRKGRLRLYLNGKLFHTIQDIEEIIPRGLDTDKEKQVGVPFNISWGGGTQGLRENLIFSSTTLPNGPYIQDPECFSDIDLSETTFSGLSTNILLNKYFAGTFEGAVSQFRMYVSPLSAPEVKHNFKLLKNTFRMFNPDCPDCSTDVCLVDDFTYEVINNLEIQEPSEFKADSKLLGRLHIPDNRDKNYLIKDNYDFLLSISKAPKVIVKKPLPSKSRQVISPTPSTSRRSIPLLTKTPTPTPTPTVTPQITSKYWDDNGWWGNQGSTPQCVGYAWSHWVEDGPTEHGGTPPIVSPQTIYTEAQKIDEWPGENYAGTSVRAGAKYLKNTNKINSYYWAYDINTLINSVFNLGPVVVGTYWYSGMFYPNSNGIIRISGGIAGGHAYVINGVDKKNQLFRIKNSWGKNWGKQGHAYISFGDMSRLISMNGEICLAVENNF